ncbi:MAG: hypothetical protein Q9164_005053 [Protoblastenia rupestris]
MECHREGVLDASPNGGGVVAAGLHAAPFVLVTGGLVYLAWRGKRGKRWKKKNKEEMDVLDMIEGEDEAFEVAKNPELAAEIEKEMEEDMKEELKEGMNDPDQEIGEEMVGKLKLGLVTTEPGVIPEETEIIPAVQDEMRTQTTA